MNRWLAPRFWLVWSCLVLLGTSVSAETTKTPHFLVVFEGADASLAKTIVESLGRARETLTIELGVEHDRPLKVRLVPHLAYQGLVGRQGQSVNQ